MTARSADSPLLGPSGRRFILWLLMAAALFIAATTYRDVIQGHHPVPLDDAWSTVGEIERIETKGFKIRRLWRQHNEHRIGLPRLVFWTDYYLFGGGGEFSKAIILLIQIGHAVLLTWLARRAAGLDRLETAAFGAVAMAALLSIRNIANLDWAFQVQFVGVFLLASLSCTWLDLAARSAEGAAPRAGPRRAGLRVAGRRIMGLEVVEIRIAWLWVAAAVAAAFGASFTMANGIMLWPVLMLLGWKLRLGGRVLATIGIAAALTIGLYFTQFVTSPGHADPLETLLHPISVLSYVVRYLGSPFVILVGREVAQGLGIAGLALAVAAAWRLLRRPLPDAGGAILAIGAIMAFTVMTAYVTGLGRVTIGLNSAFTSRYATPAFVFWLSALAYLVWLSPRWRLTGPTAAMLALMAIQWAGSGEKDGEARWRDREIATGAMIAGARDPEILAAIYPEAGIPIVRRRILRSRGFAPYDRFPYRLIGATVPTGGAGGCEGFLDNWSPHGGQWRLEGWALIDGGTTSPRHILFANADGRVAGFGAPAFQRPDLPMSPDLDRDVLAGFIGFAKGPPPFTAYAVLAEDQLCPLVVAPQPDVPAAQSLQTR